ncbi:MAG: transcription antitermination factor NusB [Bacteroidales bacterium]|jgi:N utilization substance protein B|nr:transcription antitermination factor NusB [Bacteroidales bacterium]
MVSRRLLRIKVLQAYYAYSQRPDMNLKQSIAELDKSIAKSFDLFFYISMLLVDLRYFAKDKIEIAKQKFIPSDDDTDINESFINNKILQILESHNQFKQYINSEDYSWNSHPEILKQIWQSLKEDDYYRKYINLEKRSFNDDKDILIYVLNNFISENIYIDEAIEEKSIFWNDDLEFTISIIISVIRKIGKNSNTENNLIVLYRDLEDKVFAHRLLEMATIKSKEYDELIERFLKNWELERIALLDRLIMHLALVEFNYMEQIPVKVTINEYLDIAKCYSTEKSSVFINGVLDNVYIEMKQNNNLNKRGRGLLEDSL